MKKILSMFLITSSLVFADNNSIGLDTLVGATIGVAIGFVVMMILDVALG